MKPKLREGEGCYFFNLYDDASDLEKNCIAYVQQVARWFILARRYNGYLTYKFITNEEIESYLAITFNIRNKSKIKNST